MVESDDALLSVSLSLGIWGSEDGHICWARVGGVQVPEAVLYSGCQRTYGLLSQEQQLLLELRDRALDFMSEGIWIADIGGSLLYANQVHRAS